MVTAILDQNGIINLDDQSDIEEYIVTPMFFWELFNTIGSPIEQRLIQSLQQVSDRIKVTFKSVTCEKMELESKSHKELDDFINQENTWFIRDLLSNNDNQISRIRDTLASGFTKNEFSFS